MIGLALALLLMQLLHWNSLRYWEGDGLVFVFHLFMGLAVALLIIGLCSDQLPERRLLTVRPLLFVGTISYSLYLWHQLILMKLSRQPWIDAPTPYLLPALLLLGGGLSMLVAWLSWRFIERPFLRLGRRPAA